MTSFELAIAPSGFDHRVGHSRPLSITGWGIPNFHCFNWLHSSPWDSACRGGRGRNQGPDFEGIVRHMLSFAVIWVGWTGATYRVVTLMSKRDVVVGIIALWIRHPGSGIDVVSTPATGHVRTTECSLHCQMHSLLHLTKTAYSRIIFCAIARQEYCSSLKRRTCCPIANNLSGSAKAATIARDRQCAPFFSRR